MQDRPLPDIARRYNAGDIVLDQRPDGSVIMWNPDGDSIYIPMDHLSTVFTQLCAAHVNAGRLKAAMRERAKATAS